MVSGSSLARSTPASIHGRANWRTKLTVSLRAARAIPASIAAVVSCAKGPASVGEA